MIKIIKEEKQKGLGLIMSKKILEKSNWDMNIYNIKNGVVFKLTNKNMKL